MSLTFLSLLCLPLQLFCFCIFILCPILLVHQMLRQLPWVSSTLKATGFWNAAKLLALYECKYLHTINKHLSASQRCQLCASHIHILLLSVEYSINWKSNDPVQGSLVTCTKIQKRKLLQLWVVFFYQLVNSQEVIAAKEILIAVIKERDHKCQNF